MGSKLKTVLFIAGSCAAFYIGAGFSTMQEPFQYQGSYGSRFWVVILTEAVIFTYTCLSFVANSKRLGLTRGGEVYRAYCGKRIGAFFDYFAAFFCFMCFIVMCGGANSTAMQQWGLPNGAGAAILAVAVILTVVLGLDRIVDFLGVLAPLLVLFTVVIAALAIANSPTGVAQGFATTDSGKYPIVQVGGGNPVASGISEGGYVLLWYAAFLAELSSKHRERDTVAGVLVSVVVIFGSCALVDVALNANIDAVWNVDAPALVMANGINPAIGLFFAVIIFFATYTSAVPLLWTAVRKLSDEGTRRYKILTVALGALGCAIACFVPYAPLMNFILGVNGYLGFALVAFMVISDVRWALRHRADKRAATSAD